MRESRMTLDSEIVPSHTWPHDSLMWHQVIHRYSTSLANCADMCKKGTHPYWRLVVARFSDWRYVANGDGYQFVVGDMAPIEKSWLPNYRKLPLGPQTVSQPLWSHFFGQPAMHWPHQTTWRWGANSLLKIFGQPTMARWRPRRRRNFPAWYYCHICVELGPALGDVAGGRHVAIGKVNEGPNRDIASALDLIDPTAGRCAGNLRKWRNKRRPKN